MCQKNDTNTVVVRTITVLLALAGLVLIFLGPMMNNSQAKTFRYVLGEVAMVTAIAYSFQTAREMSKFAPFGTVIWFAVASVTFAYAVFWPVEW